MAVYGLRNSVDFILHYMSPLILYFLIFFYGFFFVSFLDVGVFFPGRISAAFQQGEPLSLRRELPSSICIENPMLKLRSSISNLAH